MALFDPLSNVDPNELGAHHYQVFLWPKTWQSYTGTGQHTWEVRRLAHAEEGAIPPRPGIYTLVIQPSVASHPACAYLMYVGQAADLRERFHQYMTTERRATGRPKLVRLLTVYSDYLWFCYTEVAATNLNVVEDALITAFNPPANSKISGILGRARRAFS